MPANKRSLVFRRARSAAMLAGPRAEASVPATRAPRERPSAAMHRIISYSCFALAAASLIYQIVAWQQTGHWPDFSIGGSLRFVGLGVPEFDWSGWGRVGAAFFGLPIVLCLLVIGLVVELTWARRFR